MSGGTHRAEAFAAIYGTPYRFGYDNAEPTASVGSFPFSGTPSQIFKCSIEPETVASIDNGCAMVLKLDTGAVHPTSLSGILAEGTPIAVKAEVFHNGSSQGVKLVGAGFVAANTIKIVPNASQITFTIHAIPYWLQLLDMQEQQYTDTRILGMGLIQEMYNTGFKNAEESGTAKLLQTDITGMGYVPQHFMTCLPSLTSQHVFKHCFMAVGGTKYQIPLTVRDFANPDTYNGDGFHGYSVSNGNPIANINQQLQNEGGILYSRLDGNLVMEKKPFYKATAPTPVMTIDVPDAGSPVIISSTAVPPIYKMIFELPMLATPGPKVEPEIPRFGAISTGGSGVGYTPTNFVKDIVAGGPGIGDIINAAPGNPVYTDVVTDSTDSFNTTANSSAEYKQQVEDSMSNSIDPAIVMYEYVAGEVGGAIIGPLRNIFNLDMPTYAAGLAREKLAKWQIEIPLGDTYNVDVGDCVAINYSGNGLTWTNKLFWIREVRMMLQKGIYFTKLISGIEVYPDA